jgi:protein-tyrosine phosphatase
MGQDGERYREIGIDIRRIPVRDFDLAALRKGLPACVEELKELLNDGNTVYVHCSAGMNRSPSVVVSYLHWVQKWDLDRAIEHVTSHRDCDPHVEAITLATEDRLNNMGETD